MTEVHRVIPYDKITELAQSAIAQAIERHRKLGESIAIWQDGKVVVLTADQIPVTESRLSEGKSGSDVVQERA